MARFVFGSIASAYGDAGRAQRNDGDVGDAMRWFVGAATDA